MPLAGTNARLLGGHVRDTGRTRLAAARTPHLAAAALVLLVLLAASPAHVAAHGRMSDVEYAAATPCTSTTVFPGIGRGCRHRGFIRVARPGLPPVVVHGGDQDPQPTTMLQAVAAYDLAQAPGGNGNGKGKGGGGGGSTGGGTTTPPPQPTTQTATSPSSSYPTELTSGPAWVCAAPTEYAFQIVWAPDTQNPANAATSVATIRALANDAAMQITQRGWDLTGEQRYRFKVRCNAQGEIDVPIEPLTTLGSSPTFFDVEPAIRARGYDRVDTNYLVVTNFSQPYAGIAWMGSFRSAGLYGMIAASGWTKRTFMHEMSHNLGAVADDSPNASGGSHCNDGVDVMCYGDNGYKSAYTSTRCAISLYDCGADDYFNPAPVDGSYLALHENNNIALNDPYFVVDHLVDTGPPTVTIDGALWTRPRVAARALDGSRTWRPATGITIADDSGLRTVTWMIDGGAQIIRYDTQFPLELTDGEHDVTITATDTVGNATTASGHVNVDRTSPNFRSVAASSTPSEAWLIYTRPAIASNATLATHVLFYAERSGVASVETCWVRYVDATSTDACTTPAATRTSAPLLDWAVDSVPTPVDTPDITDGSFMQVRVDRALGQALAEGDKVSVCARINDGAGNQTSTWCTPYAAVIDTIAPAAPSVPIDSRPLDTSVGDVDWLMDGNLTGYRSLTWSGADMVQDAGSDISQQACVTRDADCTSGVIADWQTAYDGIYLGSAYLRDGSLMRVCVRNVDRAGWTSGATCSDGVRVDSDSPTIALESVGDLYRGQPATIRVTLADATSGVESATVTVDYVTVAHLTGSGAHDVTVPSTLTSQRSYFHVQVSVSDQATNVGWDGRTFFVGAPPDTVVSTTTVTSSTDTTVTTTNAAGVVTVTTTPNRVTTTTSSTTNTTAATSTTSSTGTTSATDTTSGTSPPPAGTAPAASGVRCRASITRRRVIELRGCSPRARVQVLRSGRWVNAPRRRIANGPGRDPWRVLVNRRVVARGSAR